MRVSKNLADWVLRRRAIEGPSIGFVPTMGALHSGHASLVERCRKENEIAVVSIFVNPSQFNEAKDLDRYPRTMERDLTLLEELGVDDVFAPAVTDLYPDGYRFRIESKREEVMEAAYRPGFLQGVMTIVMKLFQLVRPGRAYFGEKDYQQLRTIDEMARDFFLPIDVVPCATVREVSGLAMSSRNMLLSDDSRANASWMFRALTTAGSSGEARDMLTAHGFQVDYVEEHWGRRFAAAYLDGVRLIDNVALPEGPTNDASLS
ncbi:MAG TPA: pantoate--beta-alanine ligase [Bryobacteraceae bacterium]|nr:pantoate--beta-alanine ligase [Bryobacteraceae bacterium]